jgi:hypothetical protein
MYFDMNGSPPCINSMQHGHFMEDHRSEEGMGVKPNYNDIVQNHFVCENMFERIVVSTLSLLFQFACLMCRFQTLRL